MFLSEDYIEVPSYLLPLYTYWIFFGDFYWFYYFTCYLLLCCKFRCF